MRQNKSLIMVGSFLVLALGCLAAFIGLRNREQQEPPMLVAMIFDESDHNASEWFSGIKDAKELMNFKLIYDGKPRHYIGDALRQTELIDTVIADGAQAVILRPRWCTELAECISRHSKNGIRFVLLEDQQIQQIEGPNVFSLELSFDKAVSDMLMREKDVFSSVDSIVLLSCTSSHGNTEKICAYMQTKLPKDLQVDVIEYNFDNISSLGQILRDELEHKDNYAVIALDQNAASSILYYLPDANQLYVVSSSTNMINRLRSGEISGLITSNHRLLGYRACQICLNESGSDTTSQLRSQYFTLEDLSKASALQALYPLN